MLRSRVRKSADFFSNMAEPVESTSAEFVNNQPDSQSSTERKIIKAEVKSLTFKTIKQQIGKCTLCIRTPSADLIQLPVCQCFFCRSCFITFLNNFATPRPVLTKETISISFFKRSKRNKTKETLVPSAARNSRAQGKDYRKLEVISLSIALKLATEIHISKTNG